jgi:hypothetical protein
VVVGVEQEMDLVEQLVQEGEVELEVLELVHHF